MLTTIHLNQTETDNYPARRAELQASAARWATQHNRRFAQIVGAGGRILDVLEIKS